MATYNVISGIGRDNQWFNSIGTIVAGNLLGTVRVYANSDGSFTWIEGFALTDDGTTLTGGTITAVFRSSVGTGLLPPRFEEVVGLANISASTFGALNNAGRHAFVFANGDSMNGTGGGDSLGGGPGGDVLNGGGGSDTADYTLSQGSVTVDLLGFFSNFGDATGDTYNSIENINGGQAGDSLFGSDGVNVLAGNAGSDYLDGRGDVDGLYGEGNDDTMIGGAGDDYIDGGNEFDILSFQDGTSGVTVTLGAGGSGSANVAGAGLGTDTYVGIEGLRGTFHNDDLNGNGDNNVIEGLDGEDLLRGFGGNDTIRGGLGDDWLQGGADNDNLDGEGGLNGLSYSDAGVAITFTLGASGSGVANVGDRGTDTYANIVNVDGSIHNDVITGNAQANFISGNDGGDLLFGAGGTDQFWGGNGDDMMVGGQGNDTLYGGTPTSDTSGGDMISFRDATAGVNFTLGWSLANGGDGVANLTAVGLGIDTYYDIEGVDGSSFNDTITGNPDTNTIFGRGGNDDIRTGEDNDIVYGDAGSDYIQVGYGYDIANGGSEDDMLSFYDFDAGVTFTLAAAVFPFLGASGTFNHANGSINYAQIESIGGSNAGVQSGDLLIGADNLTGNLYNNRIFGFFGNDSLNGMAGADTIEGGFGKDVIDGGADGDQMYGGKDDDRFIVENLGDRAYELVGEGTDTVVTSISYRLLASSEIERFEAAAGASALTLEGNGYGQTLVGNAGDNRLKGMVGNDTLQGGLGNDSLYGGNGVDVLTGGAGLDSFVFDFPPNRTTNVDTITDYSVADDRFLLDDAAFVGIGATGALGAARFKLGSAAMDADDRIIYDAATGRVYFDANGNVAGGQIHFATVAIGTALTAGEFLVF